MSNVPGSINLGMGTVLIVGSAGMFLRLFLRRSKTPIKMNSPQKWCMIVLLILGISLVTAALWDRQGTRPPPEWATRPLPEAVATQPSQFIPREEWPSEYRQRLESPEFLVKTKALEQSHNGFLKLYGLQRGVARADGWVTITSTGAGFSVAMPGPAADMRVSMPATDGVNVVIDTVEEKGERGVTMGVTCTRRADGKMKDAMESILKPYRAHPDKCEIREIPMAAGTGYDIASRPGKTIIRLRLYEQDGALYSLAAEYPPEHEKDVVADVEKFLDSFVMPGK